ncbi:MAG: cysteine hydrolase family protein [Wujia sp.]
MSKKFWEWEPVFDLKPEESALLIIDMQEGFVNGGPLTVPMAKEQVPNMAKLADKCREMSIPVFYSRFDYTEDMNYDFYRKMASQRGLVRADGSYMFEPEDPQVEIVKELCPMDGDIVFDKFGFDCFGHTDLDEMLRQRNVKTLMIAGTVVNWCVDSTIRGAFHRDYQVVVMADCVSGYSQAGISGEQWRDIELDLFAEAFGRVVTSSQAIHELATNLK